MTPAGPAGFDWFWEEGVSDGSDNESKESGRWHNNISLSKLYVGYYLLKGH